MSHSEARSVLLAGATGLVGTFCLKRLLADPGVSQVIAMTRRPLPESLRALDLSGKLTERQVDFNNLHDHAELLHADQIICALGTTIKKAGSQERFREIDYGYPLALAQLGLAQGARHFLLVSALGASSRSRIFYNRVKGELEEALLALPYRSITIARPSLLLGPRQEFRLAEELAKRLGFLFPARSRPVEADAVAALLTDAARQDQQGTRIVESAGIRAFASGS
jgi:uncharacterized protein YbjT (DUF2867 family)